MLEWSCDVLLAEGGVGTLEVAAAVVVVVLVLVIDNFPFLLLLEPEASGLEPVVDDV